MNGEVFTTKTTANYTGNKAKLKTFLQNGEVTDEFFINEEEQNQWKYLKGSKKTERTTAEGFKYFYSEGSMTYPDDLEKPSRTIITGEGGKTASRFKHAVLTDRGLRRLTPIELERLSMFPENHTQLDGISDTKRAFFMGNALVVGVVEKIGKSLVEKIK